MIAADFGDDSGAISRKVIEQLRDNDVLVLSAGVNGQYIRLLPPLNINRQEVSFFFRQV